MSDEFNPGSAKQMRSLIDKLEAIEGRKIDWTVLVLIGVYVAYKVTREW